MALWCIILLLLMPPHTPAQATNEPWLAPKRQIQLMQQAIRHYQNIVDAKSWNKLPVNLLLRPGDTSDAVPLLQQNLLLTKDLASIYNKSTTIYNPNIVAATTRFQRRHGLTPDGYAGPLTIAEINESPARRLQRLYNNLQRWTNTTDGLSEPFIMINIPDYTLHVLDSNKVMLEMRVIVGEPDKKTYLNKTQIHTVVVNPYWNLPASIAANEIVPLLRRNPGYLAKRNMRVYSNGKQLNPWHINWHNINRSNYSYRLIQLPGEQNELGQLKFLFKSKASQYMHDTPRKQLFAYPNRHFSHGCIRLEKPRELAHYLLKRNANYSDKAATDQLKNSQPDVRIKLQQPMPLLIVYQTCWVAENGQVQFRKDPYAYEKK